eukprot:COSAG04_NODE_6650_length_1281_cov_1.198312_1_plen_180_part_10
MTTMRQQKPAPSPAPPPPPPPAVASEPPGWERNLAPDRPATAVAANAATPVAEAHLEQQLRIQELAMTAQRQLAALQTRQEQAQRRQQQSRRRRQREETVDEAPSPSESLGSPIGGADAWAEEEDGGGEAAEKLRRRRRRWQQKQAQKQAEAGRAVRREAAIVSPSPQRLNSWQARQCH